MYIVRSNVQGGHSQSKEPTTTPCTVIILLTDVYSSNVQGGHTVIILLTDVYSSNVQGGHTVSIVMYRVGAQSQ